MKLLVHLVDLSPLAPYQSSYSMNSDAIILFGSSALLIFSMKSLSDAVRYSFGDKFRSWIHHSSSTDITSLGLGFVLSLFLNSGTALTILLAGLTSAGVLSLRQVLAILLGGAVGRTLLVQLLTFNLAEYALLIVGLGVVGLYVSQRKKKKQYAQIVIYLGMMFFSMSLIRDAGMGLQNNELFVFLFEYFKDRPLVGLLLSVAMTALTSSSAATIAFMMSFLEAQNASVLVAIPWVIGANLGTSVTAYVAVLGDGIKGKQVALGGLLVKIVGTIVCMGLMEYHAMIVEWMSPDLGRQIAHANTFFNILMVMIFLPFIGFGVKFIYYLLPTQLEKTRFRYKYLDKRCLEAPELAMAQAQREILRLSDSVEKMIQGSLRLFYHWDQEQYEKLREEDRLVDYLNKGIKLYLTQLPQSAMTSEQIEREFQLLLRTNDLESIGDVMDKHVLPQAKKMVKKGYTFTEEGWLELNRFHDKVLEIYRMSNAFFQSEERSLGIKLMLLKEEVEELVIDLSENHVKRLHENRKASQDTSSIHLDLLGNLQRIAGLAVSFAKHRVVKGADLKEQKEI